MPVPGEEGHVSFVRVSRHLARWIAVALLAIAAGACTTGDAPEGGSSGASGPSSTPAATAGRRAGFASVEEARREYLRLLEPVGKASGGVSELLDRDDPDLQAARRGILEYAAAGEGSAGALQARTWPSEVAAPVGQLVEQLLAQVQPLRQAANGTSVDEIRQRLQQVPGATAAAQVRDAFKRAGAS